MKCVTLAILIQHCAASQARNANASNPSGECFGISGKVDGDDASIFLQHGVARIHADVLQHSLFEGFFGAQNTISHQTTSKRNTEEPNHVYDMYAGLVLATVSLLLFLMVRLLVDDMASLGLPITITGTSDRDGLLDNAKFLLIITVMLNHYQGFSGEVLSAQWKHILRYTMCPLHTRTLCFMSGIVSRKELKSEAILIRLLGPLFGFCFIVSPIFHRLSHHPDNGPLETLLSGEGVQWYLEALVWWRALASLIRPFRPLMKMFTACALAAMASYVKTPFLCFDEITIFPIFIAGQLFPYDQAISKTKWRPFTAAVGLAIIVGIASIRALVPAVNLVVPPKGAVGGSSCMAGPRVDPDSMPLWWFRSLAGAFVEILKSVVFLVVVCPRARTFFTDLGAQSLYPYLLHIFVVPWLAKVTFLTPWLNDGVNVPFSLSVAAVSADILICAIVCAILASRPVRLVFGVILEPTWIHKLYAEDGKPT